MARKAIVQKIRSLLALEADQKGKPEGTLAGQMARKMMRKYAVSSGELSERKQPSRYAQEDYDIPKDFWKPNPQHEEDFVWTERDQYLYQQIRSIIEQDVGICMAVGNQCSACFWFNLDLQGFPYCSYFDSYLEYE